MVNAVKWLQGILLACKKEKLKEKKIERTLSPSAPSQRRLADSDQEKRRWISRREKEERSVEDLLFFESGLELRRHDIAVAAATALAADALTAVALAVAVHLRIAEATESSRLTMEDISATKIQSAFRSYQARKALRALKGLVKLQAVVRGYLVRKEAMATHRSMQALVTAQARARARRIQMMEEAFIVPLLTETNHRMQFIKQNCNSQYSSACNNSHSRKAAKELNVQQGSYLHNCTLLPNYMANTESSRAKARSRPRSMILLDSKT